LLLQAGGSLTCRATLARAPLGRKLDWPLESVQWSLINGRFFTLKWRVMKAGKSSLTNWDIVLCLLTSP
jgi:hypothetical protein